jgi:hypothetical protein
MMETFSMLPQNVSRMVVGHTPQPQGINEVCAGGVWRIDIGLSSGVLGGEPQVRNPKSHTLDPEARIARQNSPIISRRSRLL